MKKRSICLAAICAIAVLCLAALTACETTDNGNQQQALAERGASAINIGDLETNCISRASGSFETVNGNCVIHSITQVKGGKTNLIEATHDNLGVAQIDRSGVIDPRFVGSKR